MSFKLQASVAAPRGSSDPTSTDDVMTGRSRAPVDRLDRSDRSGKGPKRAEKARPEPARSGRRADFSAAYKALTRFSDAFAKLDVKTQVAAMGIFPGAVPATDGLLPPLNLAPDRVRELNAFGGRLALAKAALELLAVGRSPGTPAVFAVGGSAPRAPDGEEAARKRLVLRDQAVRDCFPAEAAQAALASTSEWVLRMLRGADPETGAARRDAFSRAASAVHRAANALGRVNQERLLAMMTTLEPPTGVDGPTAASLLGDAGELEGPSPVESQSVEVEILRDQLRRVSLALIALRDRESSVPRGAPPVRDPVVFAVEGLGAIWKRFRPAVPLSISENHGRFGGFAISFLTAPPLDLPEPNVRTAVRYYVHPVT